MSPSLLATVTAGIRGVPLRNRTADVYAGCTRHPEVEQHHVRMQAIDEAQRLLAIPRLADNLEVGLGPQDRAQSFPNDRVVVHHQQPDPACLHESPFRVQAPATPPLTPAAPAGSLPSAPRPARRCYTPPTHRPGSRPAPPPSAARNGRASAGNRPTPRPGCRHRRPGPRP